MICRPEGEAFSATDYSVSLNRLDLLRLQEAYGLGRWRKLKGVANVRLKNGRIRTAEIHWYAAHGIGRREFKIKRFIDAT